MTVDMVREKLEDYVGKEVKIKYNLGRNKYEKYSAKIKELYSNIFLVELEDETREIKSFSYSDVITKMIKIDF